MSSAPRLAWIGLGGMGIAMSANLAKGIKPQELKVYNRTISRSEQLAKESDALIEVTSTLSELASGSDIIFICLADDHAVESSIDELLRTDMKGKLICDMSTLHPDTTRRLCKKLNAAGAEFVAAPVFGPPPAAIAAKLVVVKAGDPEAIKKLNPYFEYMSRTSLSLGDEVGLASLMKLTGNSFILSMVETIAEGLTFAEVSGLGTDNVMQFILTMLGGPWEAYAQRMVSGAYMPAEGERPGFTVHGAHKDCTHALNLAKNSTPSYKMTILTHVQENLQKARTDEAYQGRGDLSSVYGVERNRAGLDTENEAVKARGKKQQ